MPDHYNDKKKKANTKPNKSGLVQVGTAGGGSTYVRKSSPKGKMAEKARKLMKMKDSGKKLLRSEELIVKKYFNPTKERSYKKKK